MLFNQENSNSLAVNNMHYPYKMKLKRYSKTKEIHNNSVMRLSQGQLTNCIIIKDCSYMKISYNLISGTYVVLFVHIAFFVVYEVSSQRTISITNIKYLFRRS